MQGNYQLNYSLVAYIVLSSLFLQSCDSFSTQVTATPEESTSGNPETTKIVEREEKLSTREATALGYFEDLPIELVPMIFSEVEYPYILTCRQLNHFFYELITGYSQVGLIGVAHKPIAKMQIPTSDLNKCIDFRKLSCTPKTIPSFPFYCLLRKASNLPQSFWPYIPNTQIHMLNLRYNKIDDSDLQALAKVLPNTQVHTLYLSYNYIGASGVQALAKVLPSTQVHTLDLSYNVIGTSSVQALAKVLSSTQVHTLDLSYTDMGISGVEELAKVLPSTQVHTLNLYGDQIGDSGVQELAKVLSSTQVHTLDLSQNQIGGSGVQELAKVLPSTQIHTLHLGFNQIGAPGVQELAKILPSTQVHTLNLYGNQIGAQMKQLLKEQYPKITFSF